MLFCMGDLVLVIKDLSSGRAQGYETIKLATEVVDFGSNDLEEEVRLSLLGETGSGLWLSEA